MIGYVLLIACGAAGLFNVIAHDWARRKFEGNKILQSLMGQRLNIWAFAMTMCMILAGLVGCFDYKTGLSLPTLAVLSTSMSLASGMSTLFFVNSRRGIA